MSKQQNLFSPSWKSKQQTKQIPTKWLQPTSLPHSHSSKKEVDRINEAKAPEWLDAKFKTKEFDISNDDRPKMAKIGDYWREEQTTEIVNLLKEFQDVFDQDYKYLKGLFH